MSGVVTNWAAKEKILIYRAVDDGLKSGLPPVGKVDLTKNACIVSSKTDEVFDDGTTHFSAEARGAS